MTFDQREATARLCAILASDRALGEKATLRLPLPGSPECDEVFLAAWEAFRHVTTQIGHRYAREQRLSKLRPLDAFVRGREVAPAHIRWAETEAMIRAGEWSPSAAIRSDGCLADHDKKAGS